MPLAPKVSVTRWSRWSLKAQLPACVQDRCAYAQLVNASWGKLLPFLFAIVAALSRWPGLLPQNFSLFYGLCFCAGAFFAPRMRWTLPLGTLLVTDLVLNIFVYKVSPFQPYLLLNYICFAGLILTGTKFGSRASFGKLLAGGIVGAVLFYLITNTAAWLFNPFGNVEYTRTLAGWLTALTKGTAGYPSTLEFFRNTLLSGGLFTALFAGAMKASEAAESAREKQEEAPEGTPEGEHEEEPAKA